MGIPCSFDPLGSGASGYKEGEVLVDDRSGTSTWIEINIKQDGIYKLDLTAAGGWGGWRANSLSACGGGGGSGVYLEVEIYLKKGRYWYSVAPGSLTARNGSTFTATMPYSDDTTILATQGGAGATNRELGAGGTGWIANNPFGHIRIISQRNGNPGTRGGSGAVGIGGASVDPLDVYGKGGDGTCQSGTTTPQIPGNSGRVFIQYLRPYEFTPGSIIVEEVNSSAVKSILLMPGIYKVELVGAGGGQGGFATASGIGFGSGGGGSGAAFVANMTVATEAIFDYYAGNVGSTNRGYVGTGGDGSNSWISEHNNLNIRYYCNSAGTGSGGWDSHGNGGTLVNQGGFQEKYFSNITVASNGNRGTDGGVAGGWGTGGASVYQGFGAGAGGDQGDGSHGLVRITYLSGL